MPDTPEITRRREHRRNLAQRIRDLRRRLFTIPRDELNDLARLMIRTEQAGSIRPHRVLQEATALQHAVDKTLNNARWHEQHNTGHTVNTSAAEHQQRIATELRTWATTQLHTP